MADNTQSPNRSDGNSMSQSGNNQTMQHEQAKASVGGENREKSAIGGGDDRSQTGEAGRARSELGENSGETRKAEKQGEFSNQR